MDWGLCRSTKAGHPNRFLRDKINYAHKFYYWCIVTDFLLRFWWIAALFAWTHGEKGLFFHDFKLLAGIAIFAEAFRRGQWCLIRVENEQNNNFEDYRNIMIIPPIAEAQEENENDNQIH